MTNSSKSATSSRTLMPLVFLFVFVDILGFSIVLPLFPYWREMFSASPTAVGVLGSANAIAQLIAAPIIGMLSDRYGRRPLLVLCLAGTFISFLLMATNIQNYWIVLASRVLDGLLGGNISLAQAYVSDLSEPGPERSKRLGLLMAAYGLGFTVGPGIGGALGNKAGKAGPVWLAAILTGLNFIGVFSLLKESLPENKRASKLSLKQHPPATRVLKFLSKPQLGPLLILRFVNGFAFTCVVETAFGFFNAERMGYTSRQSSYFMALIGLVYSLVQSRISIADKRYGRRTLLYLALGVASAALSVWAGSRSTMIVVITACLYAAASGTVNTVVYSLITQTVEQQNLGGALGLTAAVGSLTRVVAPTLSGFAIEKGGIMAPHLLCTALLLAATQLIAHSFPKSPIKPKQK